MMSYNKKCKGCGGFLTDDQNSASYVPKFDADKTLYCYRCFRIKHYNEVNYTEQSAAMVEDVINKLDFNYALVFLIVDVLDLEHTLFKLPESAKNICIVVNKMDLLPNDINYEKVCENICTNIKAHNIGESKILFASIDSKSSLARIEDQIYATRKLKHIFVGKSNVGKSSIINALLSRHNLNPTLTCSSTINTTINLQKVNFPKYQIIDTPGFLTKENILNYIDKKQAKNVFINDGLKPTIFQVKVPRTLCIENLIQINLTPYDNKIGTAICLMNDQLNLSTCKFAIEDKLVYPDRINYNVKDFHCSTKEFNFTEERTNLCISGLGLMAFKNIQKCEIRCLAKVGVSLLKIAIA